MIVYRRMTLGDVDAVARLGCEALRVHAADVPLHVSPDKVRDIVHRFCVFQEHFHLVAFKNGQPVGAIGLAVAEMPFHERFEGHVMMCYATEPGTGMRLVRSMMAWVMRDVRIQRIQWAMNHGADRFAAVVRRRCKFTHRIDNLIFYKGG